MGRQERPLTASYAAGWAGPIVADMLRDPLKKISASDRTKLLMPALIGLDIPIETAQRMAKWLQSYAYIEGMDIEKIFGGAFELGEGTGMVIEKDISVIALCEHHLLPFMGRAAIGYIPHKKVVGLSKMKRLVDYLTLKPTMQEMITHRAASIMDEYLEPHGVMVVMYDMVHMCLSSRGVKDEHANTTTSAVRGVFAPGHEEAPAARGEFLSLLQV